MTRVAGLGLWLTVLAAVAAMSFACSASEPSPRAAPSPTASSTDFISGGPCPPVDVGELPEDAGCVTSAEGSRATLVVYALVDDERIPRSWHIRLETDIGAIDQPLDAGNPYSYPRAIGAADVNGDGFEDWWVKANDLTGHGTPWQRANLFVQVLDSLALVTLEGEPLPINVGGISRLGEGATCRGGHLVLLRAEARNVRNTRWVYSERTYEIDGTRALLIRRTEDVLRLTDYNDPKLDRFYAIRCNGLRYPPGY
jgi:hypothetical protein